MFKNNVEIKEFEKKISPIKINYHYYSKKRNIGTKRNNLVKIAKYKHLAMMDTDDHYARSYLMYSIEKMKLEKHTLVGSNSMIFCFPLNDFKFTLLLTQGLQNIHEATMVFTKDHWKNSRGFKNKQQNEGVNMAYNQKSGLTEIDKLMFCICHNNNTVEKKRFIENQSLEIELHDDLKKLILRTIK